MLIFSLIKKNILMNNDFFKSSQTLFSNGCEWPRKNQICSFVIIFRYEYGRGEEKNFGLNGRRIYQILSVINEAKNKFYLLLFWYTSTYLRSKTILFSVFKLHLCIACTWRFIEVLASDVAECVNWPTNQMLLKVFSCNKCPVLEISGSNVDLNFKAELT